jgi:hypothetical protein
MFLRQPWDTVAGDTRGTVELGVRWEGDKRETSTADGIEEWTGNGRLGWG